MRDFLFVLDRDAPKSLQSQVREKLVSAILAGHLKPGEKLPSTRHLSKQLSKFEGKTAKAEKQNY